MRRATLEAVRLTGSWLEVRLGGDWTVGARVPDDEALTQELKSPEIAKLKFSTTELGQWDSLLLAQLMRLIESSGQRHVALDLTGLPHEVRSILQLAYAVPERSGARRVQRDVHFVDALGARALALAQDLLGLMEFVGAATQSFGRLLIGRARFRRVDLLQVAQDCGAMALPIVALISLLVGLILAFVGAVQLQNFGAQIYIAGLVGLGMSREMGALMTAIIVSGRTGAAFAAQLGTMNVNQEVDALKVMGLSIFDFLVLPRMLALIAMMPFLCLYSILMGIVGGAIVATLVFDISLTEYLNETQRVVHLRHFMIGLGKGAMFGVLIAISGCMRGLQCGRSAAGVGAAATSSVVTSIVLIVVSDAIVTLILNRLHW